MSSDVTPREELERWRERREQNEKDLAETNAELKPILERAQEEENLTVMQMAEILGFSRNSVYAYLKKKETND